MSMFLRSVAMLACLALSACGPSGQAIDEVKAFFNQVLNDPQSAQYRNLQYFVKTEKLPERVCGQINYKNQMGGYVGFEPFVARKSPEWRVIMGGPSDPTENKLAVLDACMPEEGA
ncbi:MAG: hypothetical protein EOP84_00790 [Verrucomicrobiaceae bacterium]|nr:MAG: hypothetical protein EOP84_00790 [Verrucomicrobiaceae bacterium]